MSKEWSKVIEFPERDDYGMDTGKTAKGQVGYIGNSESMVWLVDGLYRCSWNTAEFAAMCEAIDDFRKQYEPAPGERDGGTE